MDKKFKLINYKFLATYEEWFNNVIIENYTFKIKIEKRQKDNDILVKKIKKESLDIETRRTLDDWNSLKKYRFLKVKYCFSLISFVVNNESKFVIRDFSLNNKKNDSEIIKSLKKLLNLETLLCIIQILFILILKKPIFNESFIPKLTKRMKYQL
ncbi:hypothetical protein MENTO_v1c03320 [Mesoplasma entomophilum]|uniref:Uncharacterized protein n=1 Tax=Mesoplasma entomophilum TaxID=2149 RepID=A0A3S5XYZ2_9MOLU|nr:hypothetical protein [Mesoplasma entomophilum]ATQ35478.1 hypothetical protein CS528_01715 [Mesoplasma entomophilum]ATZ19438.1 hypothetical protein MENTO_v1c03320 [Mesoplasma entomophilum]